MTASNLLAKTNFAAGPLTKLLVSDGYNTDSTAVLSSFQDLASLAGIDLSGIMGGKLAGVSKLLTGDLKGLAGSLGGGKLGSLGDIAKMGNNLSGITAALSSGMSLSPEAVMQRLVSGNAGLAGAFADIDKSIKGGFVIPSDLINKVQATVNGIVSSVSGADLGSLKGLTNLVNTLSGPTHPFQTTFNDIGGAVSLITGLTSESSKMGLSGVFSNLVAGVTNSQILINSAKSLLPNAIATGNLSMFMDIANSMTKGAIGSLIPDSIKQVITGLRLPSGKGDQSLLELFNNLTTSFNNIDDDWMNYDRGNGSYAISSNIVKSSSVFIDLLKAKANIDLRPSYTITEVGGIDVITRSTHDSDYEFGIVAAALDRTTVDMELKRNFPTVSIKTDVLKEKITAIDAVSYNRYVR